jgi:lipid-binding SYLF domain-containing protein
MRIANLPLSLVCLFTIASCTSTGIGGGNAAERRQGILEMRQDVLTELYSIKPDTRVQIGSAAGYAVFTNANINLILASFGGGVGVVRDNENGGETFMRMGEVGIGLGAGVKDFRAVFVFHDRAALDRFMDVGIAVGGQADAAAKAGDLGAAVGGEAIVDNVTAYQLTQSGLALQATIKGTRYWHDSQLN